MAREYATTDEKAGAATGWAANFGIVSTRLALLLSSAIGKNLAGMRE